MLNIIIEYGKISTLVQKRMKRTSKTEFTMLDNCVYSTCFHFFYHLYKKIKNV